MSHETMKERVQQTLNAELSRVRTSPGERGSMYENAIGGARVKRKLTTGLVFALVLVLMTAAAVAAVLLTRREIVEQVAVPLAIENDTADRVQDTYTPEQLAQLVRTMEENGFTLEENNRIMQLMQSGQGYWEEETIMELCRQAFGGNFYTWTLEEQDWFNHLMVDIGYYESYESCLPGEDNLTYEQAEATAFDALRRAYGEELHPEDRSLYQLSRQFYLDRENGNRATWFFMLSPTDVFHGEYSVRFEDRDPANTMSCWGETPDWTAPYTGDQLLSSFCGVYSWFMNQWPQAVWQQLHEMMQGAELNPEGFSYAEQLGYRLTAYPEPGEGDIPRAEAIRLAREALGKDRAALNSAVLTEYEGSRAWLVAMVIYAPEDGSADEEAGTYVIDLSSADGRVESLRKATGDDRAYMAYVPEKVYALTREGVLQQSDFIRLAAEAITQAHPGLDLMNEAEYDIRDWGGRSRHEIHFITRNIHHGNASAAVAQDGTVSEIQVDEEPLTGDNLMARYREAYGYFGSWNQDIWVRLSQDMAGLEPTTLAGRLLKLGQYPAESTVRIDHEEAQRLAILLSGKRSAEVNTCVLIASEPNPVWKLRLIADDPEDLVLEIDAQTGEVVATDIFKTDYTPTYVLYATERNWRRLALEVEGPVWLAKQAITYAYGDLWLDFPELDVDNPEQYTMEQEGWILRFLGRWAGMKSYEVELSPEGQVLRCEEKDADATEEMPQDSEEQVVHANEPYELVPEQGWKTWEEIRVIAEEAFRAVAKDQVEKEWLDAVRYEGALWNDCYLLEEGRWMGEPGWFVNVETWEEERQLWNSKGYVILDVNGNVMTASLELDGNG